MIEFSNMSSNDIFQEQMKRTWKVSQHFSSTKKQVGSPTKARAGFLKIGLPLNWKASVGFTKWGTVIFSDLVSKGRLARLE